MSEELKTYDFPVDHGDFTTTIELFYFKSEADVVIAELEAKNEAMESELAALKEAQRWRKCSEELPKYDEYVFAFCPDYGSVEKARLLEDGEWRDSDWNFLEVTHWMPLLKAPEDGK